MKANVLRYAVVCIVKILIIVILGLHVTGERERGGGGHGVKIILHMFKQKQSNHTSKVALQFWTQQSKQMQPSQKQSITSKLQYLHFNGGGGGGGGGERCNSAR